MRILGSVPGALAALGTLLVVCGLGAHAQPKVTIVGGPTFDYGTLHSTMKVKRLVTVRNDGADTLRIAEVSTSCGCTAAMLSRPVLAPGDSGTLEVAFDPRKFTGKVDKSVSMKTNDPKDPTPHLHFTALVEKVLEVAPEYVVFRAAVGRPATEYVTITNLSDAPVTVTGVHSASPLVAVGPSERTLKPSESFRVPVTFSPTRTGAQNGDLTVASTHPDVPSIPLRFFALVVDAAADPDSAR